MSKLYFYYSTMNAGKSAVLLQTAHNYEDDHKMRPILFTAAIDNRSQTGNITSRTGLTKPANIFTDKTNLFKEIEETHTATHLDCALLDEAQFLTKKQVDQLAKVTDQLAIPVLCYGLRTDFRGELFEGSKRLLAIADNLEEIKTLCHCGKKATMVVRKINDAVVTEGNKILIGGNESYVSFCRKHWAEQTGLLK